MNTFFTCLFSIVLFGCMTNSTQPEIYLIPEGFEGRVNILFGKKTKKTAKYEQGKRVYEIPLDGVLVSDFEFQEGVINREYFLIDSLGHRSSLKVFDKKQPIDDELAIFRNGTFGVYGNSNSRKKRYFQEFYVTTSKKLDLYFSMDSISIFENKVKRKARIKF